MLNSLEEGLKMVTVHFVLKFLSVTECKKKLIRLHPGSLEILLDCLAAKPS